MLKFSSLRSAALVSVKAVAATALSQACGAGVAVAQSAPGARAVEGIWDATVIAKDCASGAVLGPPIKALLIFRRGGSFDVDNTQGRAFRGNIYGLWKAGAGTAYSANAVHLRFNEDGSYAGLNKIQRNLTLAADANSFIANLKVEVLDLDGNVVAEVCPTETAVRMSL